jgi:DNA-3-methyladenine glycosylase I
LGYDSQEREHYRAAFADFDPSKVARYDDTKVTELLANSGIVRNRLKIAAAITNARAFLEVQREFGSFDRYVWRFVKPIFDTFPTFRGGSRRRYWLPGREGESVMSLQSENI